MKFKQTMCAAAACVFLLSGCSVKVGTQIKDSAVIAHATGEAAKGKDNMEIEYLDFKKEYRYYLRTQEITDDTAEDVADQCKERRESIINYLINERIILDKAKELGISTLTAEEMDAVEEEFNELVAEQVEYFGSIAEFGEGTIEEISDADREQRGNEDFDAYLSDCGLTRDDLLMWQVNAAITNKVIEETVKDQGVEYSAAEEEFEKIVESVKQLYAEDPLEYETGSGYTSVWLPEGSRRIKHILLSFEDAFTTELQTCRENGDDEGADRLRAQKAEEMSEQTTELINMLDNGADFDELLTVYSGDLTGSSLNPDGYLLIPNGQSFMAEFQQAAYELENIGEYKTCVTDYGVHIVMYASDAAVSDEDIKGFVDYLYDSLDTNAKNEYFNETLQQWKEDYAFEIDYEAIKIDNPNATAEAVG
ncbi:MAG: peptidylprolyl isomerase [Oscillospiraceae bacterium]